MAEEAELKCISKDCGRNAAVFCAVCKQLFCETHQKTHETFSSTLASPHEVRSVEEFRQKSREENSRLCDIHKQSVIAGCELCYKPLCTKCLDDKIPDHSTCPASDQGRHFMRSPEDVALKIQAEMKEMLSELRVKELTFADEKKERKKDYDEEMEKNRTELGKLSVKAEQLHKKLVELVDQTHDGMVAHMKMKEDIMKKYESDFLEYQENCQKVHDQIFEFLKQENEVVLKNQSTMRHKLQPLISLQLKHQPLPPGLSIEFEEDEQFKVPIQLVGTPESTTNTNGVPKSLEHKDSIDVTGIRAVLYLQNGRLIHAGHNSPIAGLDFSPDVPVVEIIYALSKHKNKLYVLQYLEPEKTLHVYTIGLKDQSVRRSVLRSAGYSNHQQLAVNHKYIIFTARVSETSTVKIFSTENFSHIFDLKPVSVTLGWVWGKDFLDDALVIGDWNNGKVHNITICSLSSVRWSCSIAQPTCIRVCSQIILVGSNSKRIHVLSHQGVKLSTLCAHHTTVRVADLYRFGNQLATVDDIGNKLHIYEITDEN